MKRVLQVCLSCAFFGMLSCSQLSTSLPTGYKQVTQTELKSLSKVEYQNAKGCLVLSISNSTSNGISVAMYGDFPDAEFELIDGVDSFKFMHRDRLEMLTCASYIPWFFPIARGKTETFFLPVAELVDERGRSIAGQINLSSMNGGGFNLLANKS